MRPVRHKVSEGDYLVDEFRVTRLRKTQWRIFHEREGRSTVIATCVDLRRAIARIAEVIAASGENRCPECGTYVVPLGAVPHYENPARCLSGCGWTGTLTSPQSLGASRQAL
jgi:hypothetical protein